MNKVALAVVAPLLCAAPSFAHAGKAPRHKVVHTSATLKVPGFVASASDVNAAKEANGSPPEGAVADGASPAATTSAQPGASAPAAPVRDAWSPRKPPPKLKIPEWLGRAAVPVPGSTTAVAAAPSTTPAETTRPGGKAKPLTSEQQKLADLYGGEADRTNVDKIPGSHGESKHEQVSDAAIMATVTRNKKTIQPCYERALKHDDSMQRVRVDINIKVGISGSVTAVTFSERRVADSELGKCLSQTIRRWRFPSQDSEYETQFPLLLQAQ